MGQTLWGAALLAAALIGAACDREKEPVVGSPPAPTANPKSSPSVATGEDDGKAMPEAAIALPDNKGCVSRCVEAGQMRAVAPEQIESDCKATCLESCLTHCRDPASDQPSSAVKACDAKCRAELK